MRLLRLFSILPLLATPVLAQRGAAPDSAVNAISAPPTPLPSEAASAGVTRFSFIVYGDTRGRRDGLELQYEHRNVVEGMLFAIERLKNGPDPVKFVLQSGDAVVTGANATQWNVSYVPLINRLTQQGGVPYFLAPGNHDVTSANTHSAPNRQPGLRNYFAANARLIPPDGSPRRLNGYPVFAFGYGNTFFLALDSNIPDDTVQLNWARAQLTGLDRKRYAHIVAFFHHPPFSSGPHGGAIIEPQAASVRAKWMPLFRKHGVDLLFGGHEHLFEHYVERWRDSTGARRRMDQIVTGGGGAPIYTYTGEPDVRAYQQASGADSARVQHLVRPGMNAGDNPHHFVIVHVDGARVWHEVIGVDWGSSWQPYRTRIQVLGDSATRPPAP